jgi:hypothetical protein
MRFEYLPSPLRQGWEVQRDCGTAAKSDLLWYFFPGDVVIDGEDTTFRTSFGWVPAFHFVASQLQVADRAAAGEREYRYFFTESDDWVLYQFDKGGIEVTCSFAQGSLLIQQEDFSNEARAFAARTIASLGNRFPRLLENPAVVEIVGTSGAA